MTTQPPPALPALDLHTLAWTDFAAIAARRFPDVTPNYLPYQTTSMGGPVLVPVTQPPPGPSRLWLARSHVKSAIKLLYDLRIILFALVWRLAWSLGQAAAVIILLDSARKQESPTVLGKTQWKACGSANTLIAMCCLWVSIALVDVCVSCGIFRHSWKCHLSTTFLEDAPAVWTGGRILDKWEIYCMRAGVVWSFSMACILAYATERAHTQCKKTSPLIWKLSLGLIFAIYARFILNLICLVLPLIFPSIGHRFTTLFARMGGHLWRSNNTAGSSSLSAFPLPSATHYDEESDIVRTTEAHRKEKVDRIPLVLYIPSPPQVVTEVTQTPVEDDLKPKIAYPPLVYSPTTSSLKITPIPIPQPLPPRRVRNVTNPFRFLSGALTHTRAPSQPPTWEDLWVRDDALPFVRLDTHRAACSICLADFDEPRRKDIEMDINDEKKSSGWKGRLRNLRKDKKEEGETKEELVDIDHPEPLRLLACGHVFHMTCLDPWLITVSDRCPSCRQVVD